MDTERTVHLPGGKRSAMQTEPMTVLLGGESVAKNTREVFFRDADSVVLHSDDYVLGGLTHMDFKTFFLGCLFVERIFGVPQKVDENLQYLVAINYRRGHAVFEILNHPHVMAIE